MNVDELLEHPAQRRGWLLIKALECAPLDQAIGLARAADLFILGDAHRGYSGASVSETAAEHLEPTRNSGEVEPSLENRRTPCAKAKSSHIVLTPDQREELFRRAVKGTKNAELAAEFGLTPRQVQALRMGADRAAKRRPLDTENTPDPMIVASREEVVRYLRQRDDVVVPDGDGVFLVNGRFRLSLSELIAKANRARCRQNKPLFKVEEQSGTVVSCLTAQLAAASSR